MIPLERSSLCHEPDTVALPPDLSRWLDRRALAHLAERIALSVDEDQLVPAFAPDIRRTPPLRSLLAMLVYAYAVGTFCSEEVEELMDQDEVFRTLAGEEAPDWQCLRRFRRLNRPVIQHCLGDVLGWAAQWASVGWAPEGSADLGRGVVSTVWRDPLPAPNGAIVPDWRSPIAEEASHRLNRAVQLDSMMADV